MAVAAGVVLIPGAPLGLLTTAVQALAGVLLPSASVFLLLLCNDPEVLGPWVNARWLNITAGVIIGLLLTLSGTLVVTTLFSQINAALTAIWLAAALIARAAGAGSWLRRPAPPGRGHGRARPSEHDTRRTRELADAAARAAQAGAWSPGPSSASCCCAATWWSRCCC